MCGRGSVSPGSSLLVDPEECALHRGGTPTLDTYRHAVERELSVDFKLIRCRQPPAGVQQDIVELEVQAEVGTEWVPLTSLVLPRRWGKASLRTFLAHWQHGSGTVKDKRACPTHQKEHALLKPLPGELAEAAQTDELLQSRQNLR